MYREIDFAVYFIAPEKEAEMVFSQHVETLNTLKTGEWKSEANGMVRLAFDNSKRSFGSCSVSYELKIEKPKEEWSVCLRKCGRN